MKRAKRKPRPAAITYARWSYDFKAVHLHGLDMAVKAVPGCRLGSLYAEESTDMARVVDEATAEATRCFTARLGHNRVWPFIWRGLPR